ncbi:hypothetical protein BCR26_08740 [Enterococcus rivorum]|uniref:Uncharacterized protein n=2 Tax=Enterococcus rivorum TaxID=762845 RepID=A0A1E5L0M2_9ENTE|nr:hypothetical protein BCR26_08740 [Enterococcus rivorum]
MIYEIPMIRENEHLIFELMSRSTEDLLNEKTLTLYYLLRAARKAKDIFFREKDQERFTFFTKKNFIIENILLEREGCFPLSVSDAFLRKKQEEVQKFENNLVFKNRQKMSVLKIQ